MDDTQAEFSPVLGADVNDNVVGVWTRVKDTSFQTPIVDDSDLPLFFSRLEVVSSVFDPVLRTWGPIVPLTDNDAFDGGVRLSAASTGELLLTWLSNNDGEFLSTSESPSDLLFSVWDPVAGAWSPPAVVDSGLTGVSTHEAASNGSSAFVVVPRDPDLDQSGDAVLDLYTWDGAAWTQHPSFAAGVVDHYGPSAAYDAEGEGHIVWHQGNDIVQATLSNPSPEEVRVGSTSMAFHGSRLLNNASGNLTLLWAEIVDNGPANLFARIFDPASGVWSLDRRLTLEGETDHFDLNGAYGNDGILRAAYLANHIERVTEEVDIDGTLYTFTNVPEIGQTDLRLLEHSLIVDLAVDDGDLVVSPKQPELGDEVFVELTVHNSGDFSTGSFDVDLYLGEPGDGELLVSTASVTGPFPAGGEIELQLDFMHPGGPGDLVAVADVFGAVTEDVETNNVARSLTSNSAPVAAIFASSTSALAPPLTVNFDTSTSFDPDGDNIVASWSFGDGTLGESGFSASHTFSSTGRFPVTLSVTDECGAVGTAVVLISIGTPPGSPSALSVDGFSATWVDLSWADNSSNEEGFRVYRSEDGANFLEVGSTAADIEAFRDSPVAGDTEYTYKVEAFNSLGTSGPTNTVVVTTDPFVNLIFDDGFETGDASAWSVSVP